MKSLMPRVYGSLRANWPFVTVAVLGLAMLLTNLGTDYLWADEGDTAVLASSILKFGVPKAWDGVTFTDEIGTRRGPVRGRCRSIVPHSSGRHRRSCCGGYINAHVFAAVRAAKVVLVGVRSDFRFHRTLALLRAARLHPNEYAVASGR